MLFKGCGNLPAGHCWARVQAVEAVVEYTYYWALYCRAAYCLSSVKTYLLGTVLQGCRLFKLCQNLPAWHCVAGVQAVKAVSESTCRARCCRGASS